ncbi:MAG: RNA polymerase sporulation sigma factor SigE [Clostridia bacterium]|nr:RNA polymerase sporulation sigma factor SigE [Clostridia bacterium]
MKCSEVITRIFDKIASFRRNGGEIYYINGAETLPPPLSADEEMNMIEEMGESESARSKLVEHNLRLVVYIAKKFENVDADIEDLISIGTIGLIKAVNTYKIDKNIKLATYASRCIENEILMYIRKNAGKKCEISIDEPLSNDFDGNELLLSDILGSDEESIYKDIEAYEDKKTIKNAIMSLTKRERQIITLRFGLNGSNKELTQKEVADLLGISQSYISRLEKRIISRLKTEIAGKI